MDNISDQLDEGSSENISLPEDSITTEILPNIADHHVKAGVALRTTQDDNNLDEGVSLLLSMDDIIKGSLFIIFI